jgi:hypothetical protein
VVDLVGGLGAVLKRSRFLDLFCAIGGIADMTRNAAESA